MSRTPDGRKVSDMQIKIKRLPTGYFHIRGEGPGNWAQVKNWPCTEDELAAGNFQGNEDFLNSVIKIMAAGINEDLKHE